MHLTLLVVVQVWREIMSGVASRVASRGVGSSTSAGLLSGFAPQSSSRSSSMFRAIQSSKAVSWPALRRYLPSPRQWESSQVLRHFRHGSTVASGSGEQAQTSCLLPP